MPFINTKPHGQQLHAETALLLGGKSHHKFGIWVSVYTTAVIASLEDENCDTCSAAISPSHVTQNPLVNDGPRGK